MNPRVNSISGKVTLMIVGVSSVFALLTMLVQLVWNYLDAVDNAQNEIQGYSELILPSMAQALWDADTPLLKDMLTSIGRVPSVSGVELASRDGVYIQLGQHTDQLEAVRHKLIQLPVYYDGLHIATLSVLLDRNDIYLTLWQQMIFIVLGNGLKTLVMIFVILYLLKHLIMLRLQQLSVFADAISLSDGERIDRSLRLDRGDDEIGQVGLALERMYQRIRSDLALIRHQQRKLARRGRALSHTVARQDDLLNWLARANQLLAQVSLRFLSASPTEVSREVDFFTAELGAMMNVERVAVMAFVDGRVEYRSFWFKHADALPAKDVIIDNLALLKEKFDSSNTIVVEDIEQIRETDPLEYNYMKQVGISSVAGFAITDGDLLLGILSVARTEGPLEWFAEKSAVLTQFATALNELWVRERREKRMLELQQELMRVNVQLAEEAVTDALTGLTNRRPFTDRLEAQLEDGGVLLMVDVDYFKRYNDTYGHVAGDDVLKKLAALLKAESPDSTLLARIGGEEFAMVAPLMEPAELERVCDKLLMAVRRLQLPHVGSHLGYVTLSIGAVTLEDCHSVREAMSKADASLYLAKELGRDSAVINGTPYNPPGEWRA